MFQSHSTTSLKNHQMLRCWKSIRDIIGYPYLLKPYRRLKLNEKEKHENLIKTKKPRSNMKHTHNITITVHPTTAPTHIVLAVFIHTAAFKINYPGVSENASQNDKLSIFVLSHGTLTHSAPSIHPACIGRYIRMQCAIQHQQREQKWTSKRTNASNKKIS